MKIDIKNQIKDRDVRLLKMLILAGVLVLLMILSSPNAMAETPDETTGFLTGAEASASGDSTLISTTGIVDGDGAQASATAIASASNGGIATAIASAWASYGGTVSAAASSIATAVSNAGNTVYAYAHAEVSVSKDGSVATAVSRVGTGTWNGGDNSGGNGDNNGGGGDNGGGNGDNNGGNGDNSGDGSGIAKEKNDKDMGRGFFGYIFGKSFPERYYYFKLVAEKGSLRFDDNGTDANSSYIIARARYNMQIIASEDGLDQPQFERKYRRENYTINISEMQDRII